MKKIIIFLFILFTVIAVRTPVSAAAAIESSWGYKAGTYNSKGQIIFNSCTKDYKGHDLEQVNSNALQKLCDIKGKKTIVIPSGSTVKLSYAIYLTSNTTIIAKGATIIQTTSGRGIFYNRATALNYKSIQNVTIKGGTYKTCSSTVGCSLFQFNHGNNVTIKNVKIIGNYQSHMIELIAMRKVIVQNCKIDSIGTKRDYDNYEEAIQIDVATPLTAPNISYVRTLGGISCGGSEYVQGQGCRNIKILDCYIRGGQGISTNWIGDNGYRNKTQSNITISGNTIIGECSEGVRIYNAKNVKITDNVIKSNCTSNSIRSIGLNIHVFTTNNEISKTRLKVKDNKVYGNYSGIYITTSTSCNYGEIRVKNNKCYAKKKADALIVRNSPKKTIIKNNKSLKRG